MTTDQPISGVHLETVQLAVADLERMTSFYQSALGMQMRSRDATRVELGTDDASLLVLHHAASAAVRPPRTTGLYHLAVLMPDRQALAAALRQLVVTRTPIGGASDHGVSEAIYLDDPEGNGIEIYRDRPSSAWPRRNGELSMTLDPLDLQQLLREAPAPAAAEYRISPGTVIGHVHLNVADLRRAEQFYCGLLGMQLMQYYGDSAAFVSADGYHHHIGLNVWNGRGAPPPPTGSRGLRSVTLRAERASLSAAAARLTAAGWPAEVATASIRVRDADGHLLEITAV